LCVHARHRIDPRNALRSASRCWASLGPRYATLHVRDAHHLPGRFPAALGAPHRLHQSVHPGPTGNTVDRPLRRSPPEPDYCGGSVRLAVWGANSDKCGNRNLRVWCLPDETRGAVVRGTDLIDAPLAVSLAKAVEVIGVRKAFKLPHQQRTTLKEHFLHPFERTTYELQQALHEVSFTIAEGEFFGIIGPNGSGKSTLLKILAGIYRADSGSVTVNGRLSPFIELGVGFNMELSARDNIAINATLLGLSGRQLRERFDGIVRFAELEQHVDKKLKNYSSGMLARLSFSIAIQVDF